ncbi:hypothetical protein B0H11DRAFT_2268130, partial [Mycena galericulata]
MDPNAQLTLSGPYFIGTILVWALFGSLTIQLYDYHTAARLPDKKWLQILVYAVFVVELLQTIFITHASWTTLIVNHGSIDSLVTNTPWSSVTISLLNGIVGAAVQCFFAWRIWMLSNSLTGRTAAVVIIAVALMQCSAATAVTVEYILSGENYDSLRLPRISRAIQTWIAGNFVCDTLITISMVIILVQAQRNSRFKNTETVLNRLIINTIETGAITAGLALIQLVLFLSFPSAYYDIALEFVSGRMYSNVLIATLNGRQRSRAALQNGTNNFGTVCPDP